MSEAPSHRRPGVLPAAADAAALIGAAVDLNGFRLAEGTALAWHLAHRVSEDLDFFTFEPGVVTGTRMLALTLALARVAQPGTIDDRIDRTVHARAGDCKLSFFQLAAAWQQAPIPCRKGSMSPVRSTSAR